MSTRARSLRAWLSTMPISLLLAPTAAIASTESAKLTASDTEAGDFFGTSVWTSGDTALIAASRDADSGIDAGAIHEFTSNGGSWVERQKFAPSDGAAGDHFGSSLSVSGDTALVGAVFDDDNGVDSGSAYVFGFDGTQWVEMAKLTASDGMPGDRFGSSVALSGSVALVGAAYDDSVGFGAGAAYVFRFDGSSWVEERKLTASDGTSGDLFGESAAILGDVAVVGARNDDVNGLGSGSAYVFRFDGSSWEEEAKLTVPDGFTNQSFGDSVAIQGNTVMVGAGGDDDKGTFSGSVYVFRFDGSSWVQGEKLTASDGAEGDRFGTSISMSSDTAVIGASVGDGNEPDSGSAYVFGFDGSSWVEEEELTASDGGANDNFAHSVFVSGDIVVIGANLDDDAGTNSGTAFVFDLSAPVPVPSLGPLGLALLGSLVALAGFHWMPSLRCCGRPFVADCRVVELARRHGLVGRTASGAGRG